MTNHTQLCQSCVFVFPSVSGSYTGLQGNSCWQAKRSNRAAQAGRLQFPGSEVPGHFQRVTILMSPWDQLSCHHSTSSDSWRFPLLYLHSLLSFCLMTSCVFPPGWLGLWGLLAPFRTPWSWGYLPGETLGLPPAPSGSVLQALLLGFTHQLHSPLAMCVGWEKSLHSVFPT